MTTGRINQVAIVKHTVFAPSSRCERPHGSANRLNYTAPHPVVPHDQSLGSVDDDDRFFGTFTLTAHLVQPIIKRPIIVKFEAETHLA